MLINNGCICCSVRDELVSTVERLLERRDKFDFIIVECTGLANPGKLASAFWLDDDLESRMYLDAIVTVVDAKHVERHLDFHQNASVVANRGKKDGVDGEKDTSNEANLQIAFADVVLLNKTDLVEKDAIERLRKRIRAINAEAKIMDGGRTAGDARGFAQKGAFLGA